MGARFRSWQKSIRIHPVRSVLMVLLAVVVVLIILSILGYIFNWHWTGLVPETSEPKQHAKTLWDWLQLLIIPAVLAVAGYVINLTISRSEQAATEQRAKSEREAAEKRAETEREIALDNQREAVLEAYIDKISELLLNQHLGELLPDGKADQKFRQQQNGTIKDELKPEYEAVRNIARVRTLNVLQRLDGKRKGIMINFLSEAFLIKKNKRIIDLNAANLSGADLRVASISGGYNIKYDMFGEDLSGVMLSSANLSTLNLSGANLSGANLSEADLSEADLSGANLSEADLSGANLSRAKLIGAYNLTQQQLDQVKTCKGAILPKGLTCHRNL